MIIDIENMIGKENVKVEERPDLKPVYKIDGLDLGTYILINFTTKRKVIPELEKNILSPVAIKEFLKRYILLNLTTESKKTNKTKLKEKNVEQS
jgi:ribosomal protein S6